MGLSLLLLVLLNTQHNLNVAQTTKAREILVKTWEKALSESWATESVSEGDIILSRTQDNAFESNVGQFFYRTGIRLGGLIQPRLVWQNYEECSLQSACSLGNMKNRVNGVISNFRRSLPDSEIGSLQKVQFRRNLGSQQDWVEYYLINKLIDKASFWNMEIFLLTSKTGILYIVPLADNNDVKIDFTSLKLVMFTKGDSPEFTPSAEDICLVNQTKSHIITEEEKGISVTYWELPKLEIDYISPSGERVSAPIDPILGKLSIGSCG